MLGSLFNNVASLQACNFVKKETPTEVFSVDIAKFLRLSILKNICGRLLPDCFNGYLIHRPKGLRCIMHDSVWLQGPSHRSSFLLLIFFVCFCFALVLNRAPNCVQKSKTNTFDEPINSVFRFGSSSNLFYSKGIQSNPPW